MTLFTNPVCHSEGAERPKNLAQGKPVEEFHIASRPFAIAQGDR
jgi:hypothetical protein